MKIAHLEVMPIAFPDPPLFNVWGLHEPMALRTLLRLELDDGTVGWGEGLPGPLESIGTARLNELLRNADPTATRNILAAMRGITPGMSHGDLMRAYSIVEVACHDAVGRRLGVNVADLLGGSVRDRIEFSAYLFYKWAGHPGQEPDEWGEALDAAGMVAQTRRMVEQYGFKSLKLKGGVNPPDEEIEALVALREAFPDRPLRIDPNCGWTVDTAVSVTKRTEGLLEYLEDPVDGIDAMSEVHKRTGAVLATNMCVVERSHIKEGFEKRAVQVVLADHHYWGGLRRTQELAATCDAFGVGVSMHSNSHLGISLAAMTIVGSTIENLSYACDTHYPWNRESDIVPAGTFEFKDGTLPIPTGPGLGVDVDESRIEPLRENYREFGKTQRDDTGYLQRFVPDFEGKIPKF